MSPIKLRIGVYIPHEGGAQLLDLSPIDLFGMLRPEYLAACKLPGPLISLGIESEIQYVVTCKCYILKLGTI